jgi:DnaK suppressor protein
MKINLYSPSIIRRVTHDLARRQAELGAMLDDAAAVELHAAHDPAEVSDFKDLAIEQMNSDLRQVTTERAAAELASVNAALARLKAGSYGLCLDCDDPIPEQRLLALPAASYCASCQSSHEPRDAHQVRRPKDAPVA